MSSTIQEHKEIRISGEQQSLPLRESVYLSLRKAILTGALEPGERLTEIRLGKMLGTSRTPIREAIHRLAEEGLVAIARGSGARVAKITEQELQEVMEIRSAMDQLCARLASRRITEDGTALLQKALEEFNRAILHGGQLEIADADVAFHDVIYDAAGNSKIQGILRGLADNIYRYRYEFIRDDVHYENLLREHKEICEAIVARDEDRASEAARVHIERQWESIRTQIHAVQNAKELQS